MNNERNITKIDLVYKGEVIHDRDDMLSLTDMWKAAGSPSGRAPSDWRSLLSTVEFADHVAEILNAGKSGNDLFLSTRGGTASGTWAHWHMGLGYARYLNHDFHMWCNDVVRSHMEGKHAGTINFSDYRMAREQRLQFAQNLKMATLIGLKGPEAAIAANQATARATGFDTLAAMGVKHLKADQNDALIVPSDIGLELGLNAVEVNHLLQQHGFQEGKRTKKGKNYWVPTEKGEQYGGPMMVVQRAHDVTGSARQLKWPTSIVGVLRNIIEQVA